MGSTHGARQMTQLKISRVARVFEVKHGHGHGFISLNLSALTSFKEDLSLSFVPN